jgi:pyruvate,orthophosphate dikinase
MTAAATKRWVYGFGDGDGSMRALLGNKGANLAEMTRVLGADRVPGGLTVTTEACVDYMRTGRVPDSLDDQVDVELEALERDAGKRFGDPEDPLLLSVRSGAPVSMPGMLDTILNLGLNEQSTEGLAAASGEPRFAWDSRRRLVQMYSDVVRGVPGDVFERALTEARANAGVETDSELDATQIRALCEQFLGIFREHTGEPFPDDPREQLRSAIIAVFDSWGNERAVTYRQLNGIPDELGTAVTVQRMVYGNLGSDSGSGVAFSRDPISGEPEPDGDYLDRAQGEDVVAGVRNTEDLEGLRARMPKQHAELLESLAVLERHFRDIQDIEYTIERGRMFILQTRGAKRHARAAVRFAVDAVEEGLQDREGALETIDPTALDALLHPTFAPGAAYEKLADGKGASPGAAKGELVFTAREAIGRAAEGADVILIRPFTSADDVGGFDAARGIVTSEGGTASHAALVARGMGRPCICGASDLEIDVDARVVRVGGRTLADGDVVAIDGGSGVITTDDVELVDPEPDPNLTRVLEWSDEIRDLGVRANADSGPDARRARKLGAEGIGLCRTEHMFFGPDREPHVREMFIAGELWRRDRSAENEARFKSALERLERLQRHDFVEIFAEMDGLPVTVRLLDPPMHEFLDRKLLERELEAAQRAGEQSAIRLADQRLEVATALREANPMLGARGARLGLLLPGLYEMQARAITQAWLRAAEQGARAGVEIMIPLVTWPTELERLRQRVARVVELETAEAEAASDFEIGTMVELPRACLAAGEIAAHADFLSFGTNDLTQTALGLSRDDVERQFLPMYVEQGLLRSNPFEVLDVDGIGELVSLAVERSRATKPELRIGVCGEHGGDPASISFFNRVGLDYVSCSPFRLPIARVAAAQSTIASR